MHRNYSIYSLGILGVFSLCFACSTADNDVGSRGQGGSGGSGSGGSGGCTDGNGNTYAIGETFKGDCATCTCDAVNAPHPTCTLAVCPGTGGITGTGGSGGTNTTGTGGTTGAGTCTYKGNTYAVGATFKDDCNTCTCGSLGDTLVRCTVMACVGTGGTSGSGGGSGTSTIDGGSASEAGQPIASRCSNCGADELCVAYYDGTCTPMGSSCNKVSDATRDAILVSHQRCFSSPMGDEICGTRNGQHFWGCGEPPCASEPTLADINCYGP